MTAYFQKSGKLICKCKKLTSLFAFFSPIQNTLIKCMYRIENLILRHKYFTFESKKLKFDLLEQT